ncbi:MAG: Glu-tRNA(Gln) amidotransferase subunit GatE [Halobacteria archaeon]|nr:Glu-tRNA(Gln) amidotransferase subunit GatE [Halobacteria archaeon]
MSTNADLDYSDLGLKAGLEIHQQLDTETKLFCNCPTSLREVDEAEREFERYLHPARSELGEIDEAALEESILDRVFRYKAYDTTCLVEEDDEPPKEIDDEALETALEIAELMGMRRIDQAHVMRKIVIDGSNTTGFQRSSMVAHGGEIETSEGDVRVADLCLEEESAQRVEETDGEVVFSLDRLGIPLVEIGTEPDIRTPQQAQEAAERIGMLLRSTGKVKRGLGTVRQDINISIDEGARIEIKGVQELDMIGEIVEKEARRQKSLLEIRDKLVENEAEVGDIYDVTDVFDGTESGVLRSALDSGGRVMGVVLRGFDGVVGREIQDDRRLGTEMSDRAKKRGAGGIFHTDELPGYGITEDEIGRLRDEVEAGEDDAVAIVANSPEVAERAIEAAKERAEEALEGVPEETRDANQDGTSSYLRPLPGAARMYPETDVFSVDLGDVEVEEPELLTQRAERYEEEYGLDSNLAEQVAFGRNMPLFEKGVEMGADPSLVAQTLESDLVELRREGVPVEEITDDEILSVFELVVEDEIAKEGVPELLTGLAETEKGTDTLVDELGLRSAGRGEVEEVVEDVIDEKQGLIDEQGMGAFGALMGVVMEEMRGKADGELVSDVLQEKLGQAVNG